MGFNYTKDLKLSKVDILVTKDINVDWLPIILNCAGIISSSGSYNSHVSITCRELNIPCVIGVKHALFGFYDNDEIEINSSFGCIKIINPFNFNYVYEY